MYGRKLAESVGPRDDDDDNDDADDDDEDDDDNVWYSILTK